MSGGHNKADLTGRRFGRITVLEYTGEATSSRRSIWRCRCDCGTVFETSSDSLIRGCTRSCGCLRKENARRNCPAMHRVTRIPVVVLAPSGIRHHFASMNEAARWLGCVPSTIARNARLGRQYRGHVIELMNKA